MPQHPFPWREAFLAALREWPIVQHACDAVGIERCTAYRSRNTDKGFAEAWDDAMEAGVDKAEREAFRRAVEGLEEPVIYQGTLVPRFVTERDDEGNLVLDDRTGQPKLVAMRDATGNIVPLTIRKPSDGLLSLILKGRRKKVYADRTELTGADGGPVATTDATQRAARAATLLKLAEARKALDDLSDFV